MTETTPSPPPASGEGAPGSGEPGKLDDVLLAMDVVDTLRHRERLVARELDAEGREAELIDRLKEIYDAQGIEVSERILKDGVKALEEQRFVYKPPGDSLMVRLARLYVSREAWLGRALWGSGAIAAAALAWQVGYAGPRTAAWERFPAELAGIAADAQALAQEEAVDLEIAAIARAGTDAIRDGDRARAEVQLAALRDLEQRLKSEYALRIVSRPGEDTGFYRIPDENPAGRNYYIVVEPVRPGGEILEVPILNEETQKIEHVRKWAQRVSEATFNRIAEDKAPDRIVQNDILGVKARGMLAPTLDEPAPGGAITQW